MADAEVDDGMGWDVTRDDDGRRLVGCGLYLPRLLWAVGCGTLGHATRYVGTAANCLLALGRRGGHAFLLVGCWLVALALALEHGLGSGLGLGAMEGGTQAPGGSALIGQSRPIPRRPLAPPTVWRPRYLPFLSFLSLGPAVRCAAHCHCQLGRHIEVSVGEGTWNSHADADADLGKAGTYLDNGTALFPCLGCLFLHCTAVSRSAASHHKSQVTSGEKHESGWRTRVESYQTPGTTVTCLLSPSPVSLQCRMLFFLFPSFPSS